MKIIQENHYDKEEQAILDKAARNGKSYKKLYEEYRSGIVNTYAAEISARRLAKALRSMGTTAAEAAKAIRAGFIQAAATMKEIIKAVEEKAKKEKIEKWDCRKY